MAGGAYCGCATLLLSPGQGRRDFFEGGDVLVDVRLGMLDGDGPLLVPPIGLREYTAIDHAKPVVAPEVDVDGEPVAVIADFFGIEHEHSVGGRNCDVSLQPGFPDAFS